MKIFPHHISFRQLADYMQGGLPPDQRADLEAHVAVCSRCSSDLAQIEHLIKLMRTDASEDAPSAVVERAKDLFRSRMAFAPRSSGLYSRILAVLHFDSAGLAPALGVRSGKPGSRQLLYHAGLNEIDLRIEPADKSWTVSGQVLGESATGGIAILQGNAGTSEAVLNELSEFTLPSIQRGVYRLILNLTDVEVEIDELQIGL